MKRNEKKRFLTLLLLPALLVMLLFGTSASAEEVSVSESETETDAKEGYNIFADIFDAVQGFSTEILCTLSFIGSVTISLAYKKKLLPTVKNGLGIIGNAIGDVKEQTLASVKAQETLVSEFTQRLAAAEATLSKFESAISEIAEKTEVGTNAAEDRANMKALMSAQIEMLYELFMTSSLPQYQKDALSERIREMKEVSLGVGEEK